MILTEEKAKTKRCQESFGDGNISQHGHAFAPQVMQGGAYAVHTSPSFCIGSACMAWRWRGGMGNQDDGTGALLGYCGKVGRL